LKPQAFCVSGKVLRHSMFGSPVLPQYLVWPGHLLSK
jgi:hypothetical protein